MRPLQANDPSHVGPYRLVGRLGAGGMGVVYVAQNSRGAPVAVKTVRAELLSDAGIRQRFAREVNAAIRVASPYTARVLDADLTADLPYLVTEYVAGTTLHDVVRQSGALTGGALTGFAAGVASALVGIHHAGVVHRDLTPGNVLLSADGPRVIDLGIAQVVDDTGLTRTGTTVGTAGFLAPERIREPATTASDVFSWGALVTFAATGTGPFGTGPVDAVLYRTVHDNPDLDAVPDSLRQLVGRALSKHPTARPTAATLVAELTGQSSSDPANLAAATARLVDTAAWPATALSSGTEPIPPAETPTEALSVAPPAARFGRRLALVVAAVVGVVVAGTLAVALLTRPDGTPMSANDPADGAPTMTSPSEPDAMTPSPEDTQSLPEPNVPPPPDPAAVDLSSSLPDFHEPVHRIVVPRDDVADAILLLSGPRSGEPRPLEASLFEWDRGEYKVADSLALDCGYLESPISDDDGPTVYVPCTGGASARWLYVLQPRELDLRLFPDETRDGQYTGWAFSAWDRISDPSGPDDLNLSINTCEPSCADGAYVDYLLVYDHTFQQWDAVECTYPDGESVTFGPINVTSTGYVPSVGAC